MDPAIASKVSAWFETMYAQRDPAAHLKLHHPRALLLVGPQVLAAKELRAAPYGEILAQIDRIQESPRSPFPHPQVVETRQDGDRATALVSFGAGTATASQAGFALERASGWPQRPWRIRAATMLKSTTLPSFDALLALSLSEAAQAPPLRESGDLFLTLLELSLWRSGPPRVLTLLSLPESRFSCHDSGVCCGSLWEISANAAGHSALAAMPLDRLEPTLAPISLKPKDGGGVQISAKGCDCPYHLEDRCVLHAQAGFAPLPTCATFPVLFTQVPDGYCVSTSFVCPSARDNLGESFAERHEDFARRAWLTPEPLALVPETLEVAPGLPPMSYEVYRGMEQAWLDLLADDSRPLSWRLDDCFEVLEQATAPLDPAPERDDAQDEAGLDPLGLGLYMLVERQLPGAFSELPTMTVAERMAMPERLVAISLSGWDDELVTRYLRQVLWRKQWVTTHGPATQLRMAVLTAALVAEYARFLAWRRGDQEARRDDVSAGIQAVEIASLHADHLRRVFLENAAVKATMGNPSLMQRLWSRLPSTRASREP